VSEIKMDEEEVKKVLEDVRPMLAADGGDVEFVELDGNVVKVKLKGSCHGCPMSQITLKQGIERYLKDKIPEVEAVEQVK